MCIRAPSTRSYDQLIGGHRDKVLVYGATMCGSELEGGLATGCDYARFSETLAARGNKGIKLHTRMLPASWSPDGKMDLKACAAVRDNMGQARFTNNSARSGAFSLLPCRANEFLILGRDDLCREDVAAMSCVLMATCPRANPAARARAG
ncbi:MAG: hypothetical protein ACX93U_14380 [Salipiger thiooxidans]|uniref:hypothetical protein n=1 Tax=Salipiger thiooxidans TaxID=282683 RepID=UPI001CFB3364|nr:hypothetical protein [Salipiger thiooxidans]